MPHSASLLVVLGLAVSAVAPSTAAADVHDERRPFGFVAGHLGLGTPVGAAGAEIGLAWFWLRGSVGIGQGWRGRQVMALLRGVIPARHVRVGLGVGVSRGPSLSDLDVGWSEPGMEIVSYGDDTRWLNAEGGIEGSFSAWFIWRAYAGLGEGDRDDCLVEIDRGPRMPCAPAHREQLGAVPYTGFSVGLRFPARAPR